jgi:hypothetical protein
MKILSKAFIFVVILQSCSSTEDIAPMAPTGLTAFAVSDNQIELAWEDNATNETGFKIERKTGTESFEVIATITFDGTSYSDVNLTDNNTYVYRVYSYNASGNSVPSNEVSATTLHRIVGTWKLVKVTATDCNDPNFNFTYDFPCNSNECAKIIFEEGGHFIIDLLNSGVPETRIGFYSVSGNQLTVCFDGSCENPNEFNINGITLTITILDTSTGCHYSEVLVKL